MDWLKDFQELHQNQIYSMVQIEWWLLKYSEEYKKTNQFAQFQNFTNQIDELPNKLSPLGESNVDNTFSDLYLALDEISKFHRNEKYFEQEVFDYSKIRNSDSDVKTWISKNESFGAEKYVSFLIDYLDYDENDDDEHLNVYVSSLTDYEIFVDQADFRHTIEFLKIFNEKYWVNKNTRPKL